MKKSKCKNCRKIFAHCQCDAPEWDLSWESYEITRGDQSVIWDGSTKKLKGSRDLEYDLRMVLDGSMVEIAIPGCMLELNEWNPYAVQYVATIALANCEVSANAPDFMDLIPNIPGVIY